MDKTKSTFAFSDLDGGMSLFEGFDRDAGQYFCYIFRRDSARIVCRPWHKEETHRCERPFCLGLQFNERPGDDIGLWSSEVYVAACRHLGWKEAQPPDERITTIGRLKEL